MRFGLLLYLKNRTQCINQDFPGITTFYGNLYLRQIENIKPKSIGRTDTKWNPFLPDCLFSFVIKILSVKARKKSGDFFVQILFDGFFADPTPQILVVFCRRTTGIFQLSTQGVVERVCENPSSSKFSWSQVQE